MTLLEVLAGLGITALVVGCLWVIITLIMGPSPTKDPNSKGGHDF